MRLKRGKLRRIDVLRRAPKRSGLRFRLSTAVITNGYAYVISLSVFLCKHPWQLQIPIWNPCCIERMVFEPKKIPAEFDGAFSYQAHAFVSPHLLCARLSFDAQIKRRETQTFNMTEKIGFVRDSSSRKYYNNAVNTSCETETLKLVTNLPVSVRRWATARTSISSEAKRSAANRQQQTVAFDLVSLFMASLLGIGSES